MGFSYNDRLLIAAYFVVAFGIFMMFLYVVYPDRAETPSCTNKYWNITEEARVKRECILACSGFDIYVPIMTKDACVCCDEDASIEPYSKCIYFSLELNTTTG